MTIRVTDEEITLSYDEASDRVMIRKDEGTDKDPTYIFIERTRFVTLSQTLMRSMPWREYKSQVRSYKLGEGYSDEV